MLLSSAIRSLPWLVPCALALAAGCSQANTGFTPQTNRSAVWTGAFVGDEDYRSGFARHARTTGRPPQLLLNFTPWRQRGPLPFPENFCRFAERRDVVPVITWEPWEPWTDWYARLADIAEGKEDDRIGQWAEQARRFRRPILLRFAHEMNGDWYPWSVGKDPAQRPEDYVAAWRRIHALFQERRADNVRFVWSPNFEPVDNLASYYPGDDVVDWIGLDVYNHPKWPRSPGELIDPVYRFADRRNKPILLAEVASAERFVPTTQPDTPVRWRSKAIWIEHLFREIAERPKIQGLIWFDIAKEADWRIESSPAAARAYRRGLALLDDLKSG